MENDETKKRTSKGRRKIEIKKIENVSSRHVTFSKRRLGLFKKASEVCILTGAEIAIIVRSHSNRLSSFGHPKPDAVIDRFLKGESEVENNKGGDNGLMWWCDDVEGKTLEELEEYAAALEELRNNVTTMANEILLDHHEEVAPLISTGGVGCSLDDTTTTFANQPNFYDPNMEAALPMSTGFGC